MSLFTCCLIGIQLSLEKASCQIHIDSQTLQEIAKLQLNVAIIGKSVSKPMIHSLISFEFLNLHHTKSL